MNCIDMNAWYSRVDKPERPDYVVFDLDPPESRNGFVQAIRVAHLVREALERARAALVREDERRRRDPRPRADRAPLLVPGDVRARRARVARARGGEPGARDDRVAEEEASRRARRPPPERARQDDRVRLLGAAEAGGAGVDAAALGGARREGAAARLRHAGGAGADREARRPLRARAARRPGPRAGARCARQSQTPGNRGRTWPSGHVPGTVPGRRPEGTAVAEALRKRHEAARRAATGAASPCRRPRSPSP